MFSLHRINLASEENKRVLAMQKLEQDYRALEDSDPESSDLGRDPRWPHGWWIGPGAVLGLALLGVLGIAAGWLLYRWIYPWG